MRGSSGLASIFLLVAAGCNQDPSAGNGDQDYEPAPCPQCPPPTVGYPPGPYGLNPGSTIQSFSFQGYVDAQAESASLGTVTVGDFFNPHAGDASYQPALAADDDRLFPPGSPYGAGAKKPTALLIDIASVWCGPCNEEAKSVLNGLYAKYKPCGGEFLFQLAEGAAPSAPVTPSLLQAWVSTYHVAYPATLDASKQLFPLYSSDSFPDSAIVDTRTMKIVEVISGVPDAAFWSAYESLLDPVCLASQ
jgi:hypothetical protein